MATRRKAGRRPSKRTPANRKRNSSAKNSAASEAISSLAKLAFSRGGAGAFLLVVGAFYTAAALTNRGAFLGEAGLAATMNVLGAVGYLLPPLAVLAGALVLLRRLPHKGTAGAALLLLALSTTLAVTLDESTRFDATLYTDRGGLLGSAAYEALDTLAGPIGAALALAFLYALSASLLTGVSLATAAQRIGAAAGALWEKLKDRREDRALIERANRDQAHPRRERLVEEREEMGPLAEHPEADIGLGEVEQEEETVTEEEVFEVVLPDRRGASGGEEPGETVEVVAAGEYVPPPFSLLKVGRGDPEHDAEGTSRRLTRALSELGVEAYVVRAVVGPRVTRYELRLGSGVKVGKVRNLQQDIAYALAATEVRILAPIPGKSAVGVEVPNPRPAKVTLGDAFEEYPAANDMGLPVGLGKDISGRAVFFDLAEMPHLLVAGTTGSGKSVMLNGLLTSLLLATDPRRVKMVLIDPKRVELSQFARVPHLITPVVTDVKKAANALTWAVSEMERRYEVLEEAGARSLDGYNERHGDKEMPYVVVVIDELADLMMTAAQKVEDAIIRIAQKARAVGIHLVVATQRPSVDVITGMIKANVPSRIAFAVSSQVDSRVILDTPGAESLLGMGDMLFKPVSALRPSRVQGAYISEAEVEAVVDACAEKARARYVEEVTEAKADAKDGDDAEPEDDLLPEAASFVVASQQASVSAVQRRFRVGYSRAGRIIDALERKGVVGPYEGSKSRAVLSTELDLSRIFYGQDAPPDDPDGP